MKQLAKYVTGIILGLLFIVNFSTAEVFAAEEANGAGFSYSINYPENQIEETGYYKLKMTPGQEQTVSMTLTNPSSEDIKIDVALTGAKTNRNGVIEYSPVEIKNDPSLKFPFEDLVTGEKTVEVPAGKTVDYEMKIKMPETSFDGVILGGIYMIKQDTEKEKKTNGSIVLNKYAYAIAMVLTETDTKLDKELKLNSVSAGQSNYRNTIFVNVSNVVADYVDDLMMEVQITKQGSETVLYETKKEEMRMAPNTYLEFPVSMNGEEMVAGKYTAKILASSEGYKKEWTKDFEITKDEAGKYNERDVGLVQEKGIDWKIIAAIVGGVLAVIIILFVLIYSLRKKKKETAKKAKKAKKKSKN
ncbi:DUF916 and DUF3324 domain-containing protein [Enterococcus wangshanyuanii]|uniref:Cell surface protein n=1 Tax=Enterococcus wangshanyuanii TaxID=2005703 RepID=A0ABQ1P4U3_9ENTE|nr:DUF916 and DUF3324 domain-containing protein [Enterococcus wangshanyuanii]GGC91140.1 cell surface protein [Enterococcus wangshanyuanii]